MRKNMFTNTHHALRAVAAVTAMLCAGSVQAQYCTPVYTSGCAYGDQIAELQLSGESGTSLNDPAGTCASPYYVNNSGSMNVSLYAGNAYSLSLHTNALGYDNGKVWIDFNHNNVFDDPAELVASSTRIANTTSYLPVTIPSSAVQGTYRMRVRLNQDPAPASLTPCGSTSLGEARDYTVTLTSMPLPVVLMDFSGRISGPADLLYWKVGDTKDLSSFTVERSVDGVSFIALGTVDKKAGLAHGTETDFTFTDAQPLSGDNFYRLGVKELSGKISYSNTILLHRENAGDQMFVYPNPAKGQFHIKFTCAADEAINIDILDVNGRTVRSEQRAAAKGNNDFTFSCANLSPGNYMVHAVTGGVAQNIALVIQ